MAARENTTGLCFQLRTLEIMVSQCFGVLSRWGGGGGWGGPGPACAKQGPLIGTHTRFFIISAPVSPEQLFVFVTAVLRIDPSRPMPPLLSVASFILLEGGLGTAVGVCGGSAAGWPSEDIHQRKSCAPSAPHPWLWAPLCLPTASAFSSLPLCRRRTQRHLLGSPFPCGSQSHSSGSGTVSLL